MRQNKSQKEALQVKHQVFCSVKNKQVTSSLYVRNRMANYAILCFLGTFCRWVCRRVVTSLSLARTGPKEIKPNGP